MSKRTFLQVLALIVAAGAVYWAASFLVAWQAQRTRDAHQRQIVSDLRNSTSAIVNSSQDAVDQRDLVGNDVVAVDVVNAGRAESNSSE
jgi:hypothetical protein